MAIVARLSPRRQPPAPLMGSRRLRPGYRRLQRTADGREAGVYRCHRHSQSLRNILETDRNHQRQRASELCRISPAAPNPTPTANPSGMLCSVMAKMNRTTPANRWSVTGSVSFGFCCVRSTSASQKIVCVGTSASARSRNSAPIPTPISVGTGFPPEYSSIPGIMRLVKAAASITPAANPSRPLRGPFRRISPDENERREEIH